MEHHQGSKAGMQPMVEVPDHMAGAAAFNDMLGADSSIAPHHFGVSSPAATFETSVIVPAPPIPTAEYELPGSWKEEKPEPVAAAAAEIEHEFVATPVEAVPEPVAAEAEPETVAMEPLPDSEIKAIPAEAAEAVSAGDAAKPSHPQFIPVYKEPEANAASYEVMPTAAPPTGEIEIPREPELQETADETTRATVADRVEPGLLSTFEAEPDTARKPVAEEPASTWPSPDRLSADRSFEDRPNIAEAAIVATSEVSDADFEARVAAAMAAYSHATAPIEVQETPVVSPVQAQPERPIYAAQAAEAAPVEEAAPPSFEYRPPVRSPEPVETVSAASVASAPAVSESSADSFSANRIPVEPVTASAAHEAATPEAEIHPEVHEVVNAGVEAAAVAAATESGADHHNIAQAVHRVMERLKPELVEEIMRELRSRK
jgi:hypothetical protein